MSKQKNNILKEYETLEKEAEKKTCRRITKKKEKMKVSGAGVKGLARIIGQKAVKNAKTPKRSRASGKTDSKNVK